MTRFMSLAEAVSTLFHDGDSVAVEGFTHLIPYAAGHEIILQDRLHPDRTVEEAVAATGRPLKVSEQPSHTEPPTEAELTVPRSLTAGA